MTKIIQATGPNGQFQFRVLIEFDYAQRDGVNYHRCIASGVEFAYIIQGQDFSVRDHVFAYVQIVITMAVKKLNELSGREEAPDYINKRLHKMGFNYEQPGQSSEQSTGTTQSTGSRHADRFGDEQEATCSAAAEV